MRVAISLDPYLFNCWGRGRKNGRGVGPAPLCRNFCKNLFPRATPPPTPEAWGAHGKRRGVLVVLPLLPLVQAQAVIRAGGKHKGITCRPWMRGGDSPVPGAMLWVRLHPCNPTPRSVGQAGLKPSNPRLL